ncbi:MAG: tetratricopeptide repeat protein [Deltaproteobacteria bacterium]|nr:tetratricopeptide repeat protein [Deltaproteobacteria bacterium]
MSRKIIFLVIGLFLNLGYGSTLKAEEGPALNKDYQKSFQTSYAMGLNNKYDEAIAPLLKLYRKYPSDYIVNVRLGYLYYLKGDFKVSVDYYEKGVHIQPKAVEPYQGILLPLMGRKDYKESIKWGQRALKIDPLNYTVLSTVAYACYLNEDYKNATLYYLRLTELYPADVTMRVGLGWSYLKTGDKIKARKEFIQVLNLSPTNQLAFTGYDLSK